MTVLGSFLLLVIDPQLLTHTKKRCVNSAQDLEEHQENAKNLAFAL